MKLIKALSTLLVLVLVGCSHTSGKMNYKVTDTYVHTIIAQDGTVLLDHVSASNRIMSFTSADIYGVPNLFKVADRVWRGGQPTKEGWRYLKSIGITNVIKLNPCTAKESDAEAIRLGMVVHYFPINTLEQTFGEPSFAIVNEAAKLIGPGTFVHCKHGQDRTGLVVAVHRVRCGWTRADAELEMKQLGFHVWLRGLYWYWQDYVYERN